MSESIFVVMTNDFPDCVFSTKEKAESYCRKQNSYQKELLKDYQSGAAIFYRWYEFKVDEAGRYLTRRNQWHNQVQTKPCGERVEV